MRGKIWMLGAAVTAAMAQQPSPKGPARYAMVVTNEKYASLAALPASSKEGDTVENALLGAAFKVTRVRDFKQDEFYVKYETPFLKQVQPGDICLFYYSGYTAKVDYDDSYLLPIDFNPNDSNNMEERAVHLSRLPEDLEEKKSALKIIVVEPKQPGVQVRRATAGLIDAMLEGTQTLFAFAWPPQESAKAHPAVEAGLFTKSLVAQMAKPGKSLKEVFDAVRNEVGGETKGVQVPYTNDNLFGKEFFFHEKVAVPDPPKPPITSKKDEIQPGVPYPNRQDREEYVWIPPGHFNMGCVSNDKNCEKDESPRHPVTITKGFWMAQTEVTVNAYTRFAQDKKLKSMPPKPNYGYKSTDQPIVDVSWDQAKDFCEWSGGRLPTEAEWEYAARGNIDGEINGLGDNAREKANFNGTKGNDKFDAAAPVKQFDRNAFQLYDMLGNVWEWVNDFYDASYYSQATPGQSVVDPHGPDMGKDHVMRGGSWDSDPNKHLRLSIRRPGKAENNVGMRCVLDESSATRALLGRG